MGLSLALAAGYIISAFFPFDSGSPASGSWKQQLHNAGGIYFLLQAAQSGLQLLGVPFKTVGFVVVGCIVVTSIPNNPVRGLAQRIAELLLFALSTGVDIYLTSTHAPNTSPPSTST